MADRAEYLVTVDRAERRVTVAPVVRQATMRQATAVVAIPVRRAVDTLLAAEAGIRLGAAVDIPVVAAIPAADIANLRAWDVAGNFSR
jgi:hypothetical protein